jgi:putative ABC transport system ATP-binding protein
VPLIETRHLSRRDQGGLISLLKPTDFSLNAGDQVAITGASGSGKSVFLRLLALLDAPTTGDVLWQGKPIASAWIPLYRSGVCYVSQRPALIEGTVLDNLQFPFTLKSLNTRRFNLPLATDLLLQAGKDVTFLTRQSADLSGGESQIVALVRTLQLAPQVLLLDESTAALDPESAASVERLVKHWFTVQSDARAYVWISHDHEQARRMSTQHLIMDKGQLSAGESA